jgi:hypothetical protein
VNKVPGWGGGVTVIKLNVTDKIPESQKSWAPPTLSQYVQTDFGIPLWLLQDMLPADSSILMSGRAKLAYKTWLAFLMALCVATGKKVGPFVPMNEGGEPVLFLEAEGGRPHTKNRWLWIAKAYGIDLLSVKNLYFSHRENIVFPHRQWEDSLSQFIIDNKIKLVVVDSLAMHARGDENDVASMGEVMRVFVRFKQLGASVLFLHHLRKAQKDYTSDVDEDIRGTSAIAGFYDAHYALRQKKGSDRINILTLRSKDDEEKKFEAEWFIDKVAQTAQVRIDPISDDNEKEAAVDVLIRDMLPGEVYTAKRLGEMLNVGDAQLTAIVESMLATSVLEKTGRGYRLFTGESNESEASK